jgi:hypothetical protein
MNPKKSRAAAIISEHFKVLDMHPDVEDVYVSARDAGCRMVEIYRLLTDEMPQSPGIEAVYNADEQPAVEWAAPIERRPDELFYVKPGFGGEPDILIKGDQHGNTQDKTIQQGAAPKALLKGKGEGESE